MPLTHQQIEILFEFTRKKFVPYYDLQVELVDHLASSIEEEMQQNNIISFEQALQKVYTRFGIFGFAYVVQERQVALEKNNRRIWWQTIRAFFSFPKIVLTVLVFLSAFRLSSLLQADQRPWILYILLTGFVIISIIRFIRNAKVTKKKLLLMQFNPYFLVSGGTFPYLTFIIERNNSASNIVFAILVTAIVVIQLAIVQINRQIVKKAIELYPEAFVLT